MHCEIHVQNQNVTVEEAVRHLKTLALQGLEERFHEPEPELKDRLDRELERIAGTEGCLQRMVILWDLARYARAQQIFIGPGMGTLPGSLAAYCLGITGVNPIQYGLLFEHFLPGEDGALPRMMGLMVPARAMVELADYLGKTYPQEQRAGLLNDVLLEDDTVTHMDIVLRQAEDLGEQCPDLSAIALDSKEVYDALMDADGMLHFCCFQQGTALLSELRPSSLEELAAAAVFQARGRFKRDSLYKQYLARGEETKQPLYMQDNRGCILYLEQIMTLLREITGCSLEQAGLNVLKLRKLSRTMDAAGAPPMMVSSDGPYLWDGEGWVSVKGDDSKLTPLLVSLTRKAVDKSHFISTALLSYQAAYLYCRFPKIYEDTCLPF